MADRLDDIHEWVKEMNTRGLENARLQGDMSRQVSTMAEDLKVIKAKTHAPASNECPLTERVEALKETVIKNFDTEQRDVGRLQKANKTQGGMSKRAVGGIITGATAGAVGIIEGITALARLFR